MGLRLVDDCLESCEMSIIARRPADILQAEYDFDDLCNGLFRVCYTRAVVESRPVEGVGPHRPLGIHRGGVRELGRLGIINERLILNANITYIQLRILEASPNAIPCLNLDR